MSLTIHFARLLALRLLASRASLPPRARAAARQHARTLSYSAPTTRRPPRRSPSSPPPLSIIAARSRRPRTRTPSHFPCASRAHPPRAHPPRCSHMLRTRSVVCRTCSILHGISRACSCAARVLLASVPPYSAARGPHRRCAKRTPRCSHMQRPRARLQTLPAHVAASPEDARKNVRHGHAAHRALAAGRRSSERAQARRCAA
jgi:hypothetical protein